eukprot:356169-Chlamydomonas_euryale.AAC.3
MLHPSAWHCCVEPGSTHAPVSSSSVEMAAHQLSIVCAHVGGRGAAGGPLDGVFGTTVDGVLEGLPMRPGLASPPSRKPVCFAQESRAAWPVGRPPMLPRTMLKQPWPAMVMPQAMQPASALLHLLSPAAANFTCPPLHPPAPAGYASLCGACKPHSTLHTIYNCTVTF